MMQHKTEPMCRAGVRFVMSPPATSRPIRIDPAALVRLHGVGRVDGEASVSVAAINGLAKTCHPVTPADDAVLTFRWQG